METLKIVYTKDNENGVKEIKTIMMRGFDVSYSVCMETKASTRTNCRDFTREELEELVKAGGYLLSEAKAAASVLQTQNVK